MGTLNEAITIKIMGDATNFNKAMKNVTMKGVKAAKDIGAGFEKLGAQMMKVGAVITTAIGGALAVSTKKFMDFEKEFAAVTGLFKESKGELKAYEDAILNLSNTMGVDAVETVQGYYMAISAGFRTVEDATMVTEQATKAAIAGQTDLKVSTEAITRVLNAYGKSGKDAEHVFDLLFQTVNYGVTEFKLLAPVIGRVAGTAASAKISMEEMFSAIAVVTKALPTEEAIVAVNQMFLSFIKPASQAKDAAAALGLSIDAVTLAEKGLVGMLTNVVDKLGITEEKLAALEAMEDTSDYAENMAKMFGEASASMAQLFPNVRALRAALVLTSKGGKDFTETLEEMHNAAGSGEKAFQDQEGTLSAVFRKIKSHFSGLGIEIGKIFKTDLKKFGEGLDNTVKKFKAWIAENPKLFKNLATLAGAIGVAMLGLGAFNMAFGKLIGMGGSIIGFFAQIVFFMLNPWQLAFTMAIGAALTLFALFAPEKVNAIWTGFKTFLADGVGQMRGFIQSMKDMGDPQKENLNQLEASTTLYEKQQGKVDDLTGKLKELQQAQETLTREKTWEGVGPMKAGGSEYEAFLKDYSDQWMGLQGQIEAVTKEINAQKEILVQLPEPVKKMKGDEGFGGIDMHLESIVGNLGFGEGMAGFLDKMDEMLSSLESTLRKEDPISKWLGLWADLTSSEKWAVVLDSFAQAGKDMIKSILDGLKYAWDTLDTWLTEKFDNLLSSIIDSVVSAFNYVMSLFGSDSAGLPPGTATWMTGFKTYKHDGEFQEGGQIGGTYNEPKHILAHAGEYVINPDATAVFLPLLEMLNNSTKSGSMQDFSTNVWNFGDKVSRELVRDKIIPELEDSKARGYGRRSRLDW